MPRAEAQGSMVFERPSRKLDMDYYSASTSNIQRSDINFGDQFDATGDKAALLAQLDELLSEPDDTPTASAEPATAPLTIPELAREARRRVLSRPNKRRIRTPYWREGMSAEEFVLAGQRYRQKAYRAKLKAQVETPHVEPTSPGLPSVADINAALAAIKRWLSTDSPQVRQVRARMTAASRINLAMALCVYRECPTISQAAMAERLSDIMRLLALRNPKGAVLTREPWNRRRAQNLLKLCKAILPEMRLVQRNAA